MASSQLEDCRWKGGKIALGDSEVIPKLCVCVCLCVYMHAFTYDVRVRTKTILPLPESELV